MAIKAPVEEVATIAAKTELAIEGLALLETTEAMPEEMKLTAYVFDPAGKLLGSAPLDAKGRFNVPVHLNRPANVQLVVGPAGEPGVIRASAVYKETFHAKDWLVEGGRHLLKAKVFVPKALLTPWYPMPIAVSGHVRTTDGNPIPYLKVEIFDVDREGFFWPYLVNRALPPHPKVIRIPDLLAQRPAPSAGPELAGHPRAAAFAERTEAARFMEAVSVRPQPEPTLAEPVATRTESRVGEMAMAAPALAEKLEALTLTSRLPIWNLFPFYSKQLMDTVYTDAQGFFSSCFKWWPFHLRRGRMRFDGRPDIIVRVTQVIDGVKRVLYMDPYTSTRWNVTRTHIDLWLDDPEITAGSDVSPVAPPATQAFFTRIGNDEVFHVDQATGLYHAAPYSNVAYGHVLRFHGQFGKALSAGTPKRYYRLSYRKGAAGSFTPITTPLSDTRVNPATLNAETYLLGPHNVNGTMALYEVKDLDHYYWFNPDWLVEWNTMAVEAKTGLYTLRLEVFDENGNPLPNVDYRDGTSEPAVPPVELPQMTHCDLLLAVQNVRPAVKLEVVGVPPSGVIPWAEGLSIPLKADVSQEGGRILSWGLEYTKGLAASPEPVQAWYEGVRKEVGGLSYSGIVSASENPSVAVSDLGIDGSYALAFKLWARSHIRNGYGFVYYNEAIKAVAIQKCPNAESAKPAIQAP